MRFRVLGPVSYCVDDTWVQPRGPLKSRLLSLLLAHPNDVVRFGVLIDALWGEPTDDRAQSRLHVQIHRLRNELDHPQRIVAEETGYRLRVAIEELDSLRFEQAALTALACTGEDGARADAARCALEEWGARDGGGLLAGVAFDGSDLAACAERAARLHTLRLDVAEAMFGAEIGRGRHLDVVADLQGLAAAHPFRESLQALVMSALQRCGRQQEALQVYRDTRRVLIEELGLEPSAPLRAMHEAVLSGSLAAGGRSALPTPAQLPIAPPLVGRDAAEAELGRLLTDRPIGVVTGAPGAGKSALALAWAERRRSHYPDGQLFVDLRGYSAAPPLEPEVVLDGFLRALGCDPTGLRDLDERTATFRSLVADRRLILILDNARSAEQVRPLLPGTPSCRTVVTSRDRLSGLSIREDACRIELSGLAPADAVAVLRGEAADPAGSPDDDRQWLLLAQRCAHLPLALRVAGERVRADPYLLGVLAEASAAEEALDLLELGDPDSSAREILSWSFDALRPDATRLTQALGDNPASEIDVPGLAALAGLDLHRTRRALEEVTRAHLADLTAGWVRQHDLLAACARRSAEALPEAERTAGRTRLARHFATRVEAAIGLWERGRPAADFPTADEARAWLSRAAPTIVEVAEVAPYAADEAVATSAAALCYPLSRQGENALAERLATAGSRAAARLGDHGTEAMLLGALGVLSHRRGEWGPGEQLLRRAMVAAERSGDLTRIATSENNLGIYLLFRGRLPAAADCFTRAHRHLEALQDSRRARIARGNLGETLTRMGRLDEADPILTELHRAECAAATGGPGPTYSACRLARLQWCRGLPEPARATAELALGLARDDDNRLLECEARWLLGVVSLADGERADAELHLTAALDLARDLGDVDQTLQSLGALAQLARRDDPDRAEALLEEALALARRGGFGESEWGLLDQRADLLRDLGRAAEAQRSAEQARRRREACGVTPPAGRDPGQ